MTRSIRGTVAWLAVLAFAPSVAPASGVARRVADLRTQPNATWYVTSWEFGRAGGKALVGFDLPGFGSEPWVSDGTTAGTRLLRNVAPGSDDAAPRFLGDVAGGRALFAASSIESGNELWATDGTTAGTVLLREFVPGVDGARIWSLGALGEEQLLAVVRQAPSLEIWRSDGTAPGTALVRKLQYPIGMVEPIGIPPDSTELDGRLYFAAGDAATGLELWVSDGTDGGTYRVADLVPGSESSWPNRFVGGGERVGFTANAGAPSFASSAWILDDASPQPSPIQLPIPIQHSYVVGHVPGGLIVLSRSSPTDLRLWFSDGSPGGAVELRDLVDFGIDPRQFVQVGDRIVFSESTPATGTEPWVTDGTPAGTVMLRDIVAGSEGSWPTRGIEGHDGIYFCAEAEQALWKTDGTAAGTVLVANPAAGCEYLQGSSVLPGFTVFDICRWYYVPPHDEEERCETYRTNGSAAGTFRLMAPVERSASQPASLTTRPGGLVFAAYPDVTAPPWDGLFGFASDGSAPGTVELTLANGDPVPITGAIEALPDDSILVGDYDGIYGRLSRVDGVELVPLASWTDGPVGWLRASGDLAYFSTWEPIAGQELWASDGTSLGTGLMRDVEPGVEGSFPEWLTDVGGMLVFAATTTALGTELWTSDGSMAGTLPHDLAPGPASAWDGLWWPRPFRPELGRIVVSDLAGFWVVDLVADERTLLRPTTEDELGVSDATTVGSGDATRLLYWAWEPGEGCVLRSSDGTPGDIEILPDVAPTGDPEDPVAFCGDQVISAGATVYFASCAVATGCELWSTDGTPGGSSLFADLEPGPASSAPRGLTVIGDRLYFAACRQATGCEPWISDFTAAGTHPLADIAPGPASSDPSSFTRSDPYVYFSADDGTGSELWVVPIEIFYDGFQTGDLSRWSAAP
ncbi:MAG: hypothetical protein AMXMBFR36_29490 [Acidobacteriota bacterium]